ncbi:Amiloride-sensitive sodium channel [Trichostrongylus colubriformis]|uniref:Amiloride-sensitive sodium channel n=1 Tax=Trichostrongylus colubriformis TaxID=6319 RepID=A0AAN8FKM4_TRICO
MSSSGDGESARAGERVYLHIYDYETKEFSGLTTYHGLVRIYNSNTWPSRIFWCVVVLSCLSLFMIHSGYLLLGYHSKPTLFQVKTIVVSDGMSFPDITLCNHNPLKMSRLSDYNMSKAVQSYLLSFLDDHVERDDLEEEHRAFEEYKRSYRLQNERNFSTADFFFHVRPTCDDLVLSCSFAGEDIENCCTNSEVALTDIGYCIRFPYSMLKKKQFVSGRGYGWQFILDRSSDSAPDSPILSDTGFYLVVQEPEKEVSVRSKGLSVPPGATLHAGISYRNVSHLQRSEWGFCQQKWSPELHGSTPIGLKYTLAHCEWNCLLQEWLLTCGCRPMTLSLNISTDAGICTPYDMHRCANVVYENAMKCDCDIECDLIDYDVQVSYSELAISTTQRKFNFSEQYIQANISVMNIFFRSMTYERHEQQKQLQTADLLSNIAGSMGLFLGMSTVTLLEIFIYLFKSVWGTVNTERQKQFMEAMMEEENERRQSLVIVEEPHRQASLAEELAHVNGSHTRKRLSRRISVVPLHIHMDKRGSNNLSFRDAPLHSQEAAAHRNVFSSRKSLVSSAFDRRGSTMDGAISSLSPKFQHHRKSIAVGALGRRGSHLEGAGEILITRQGSMAVMPHAYRRSSSVAVTTGPSNRRPSVQPSDDTLHLIVNHRRPSAHPKHFLI